MLYVTLVNRSSKELIGTWNGKRTVIAPGKNSFPEIMAVKFKEQNPVMGTLDPYSMDRDYLCGIEEYNDPIDPIEQTNKVELFDRKKMDPIAAKATELKTSVGRLYKSEQTSPLPADNGFVSPKV